MVETLRFRASWSGISGGAGTSTWHVQRSDNAAVTVANANACHTRFRAFFENTSEWIPNDATISFPAAIDVIDDTTGDLASTITASSPATPVPGAYTGNWQNGVGTRLVWDTGAVVLGRRRRGFTYLVPYGGIFDTDGTLSSTATSDVATNAASLLSGLATDGLELGLYSAVLNTFRAFTAVSVTDKPVVLRTRRD